jgi:hypothetical protein
MAWWNGGIAVERTLSVPGRPALIGCPLALWFIALAETVFGTLLVLPHPYLSSPELPPTSEFLEKSPIIKPLLHRIPFPQTC